MRNYSGQTPESRFENIIADLVRKVEELRTNQLSVLVVPEAADPVTPIEGQNLGEYDKSFIKNIS